MKQRLILCLLIEVHPGCTPSTAFMSALAAMRAVVTSAGLLYSRRSAAASLWAWQDVRLLAPCVRLRVFCKVLMGHWHTDPDLSRSSVPASGPQPACPPRGPSPASGSHRPAEIAIAGFEFKEAEVSCKGRLGCSGTARKTARPGAQRKAQSCRQSCIRLSDHCRDLRRKNEGIPETARRTEAKEQLWRRRHR